MSVLLAPYHILRRDQPASNHSQTDKFFRIHHPSVFEMLKNEDACNNLQFNHLCQLFEQIDKTQGTNKKLKLLFNKEIKKRLNGQSIFPLLRLVLPLNDTYRGKYNLKQASIAKTYVTALHLDKHTSQDAQRLLFWKDPSKVHGVDSSKIISGDFGTILEDVLKSRVQSESCKATIGEVNAILDELTVASGEKEKTAIIRDKILKNFNANEQKWIVRIIFQDLKIGLKHENVLGGFYKNALQRFNECTDLKLVCEEEGITSELKGIQLFTKFSPMLAKGFSKSNDNQISIVEHALKEEPFVMDLKLDGERMLCHISKNNIMMFTRRGSDYTENYMPLAYIIKNNLNNNSEECILDGEVCAFNKITKTNMPFGNNLSIARNERELFDTAKYNNNDEDNNTEMIQNKNWDVTLNSCMKFIAFDVIYLSGQSGLELIESTMEEYGIYGRNAPVGEITNLPLIVRRKVLEKIVKPVENRFEIVENVVVTSLDRVVRMNEIENYFNKIILENQEGFLFAFIFKNLNK
jgi:hypothetical protein